MQLKVYGLIGALVVTGAALFFMYGGKTAEAPETRGDQRIWIEIISDSVSVGEKTLQNGDTVDIGATLVTGDAGKATLHFPDASTATLEPGTTITVNEALYAPDTKSMVSQLFLTAGKVFFSITELATPESKWEVKTGNAVAVVRGTKFSVAYTNGSTSVAVTEDTVSVAALDPETGEIIPDTEVYVEEGSDTTVTDEAIEKNEPLIVRKVEEMLEGDEDVRTDTEDETDTIEKIDTQRPVPINPPTPTPSVTTDTQAPSGGGSASSPAPKPESLSVNGVIPAKVTEKDTLKFTAMVSLSDGTTADVTREAKWSVVGGIGKITSPGVFLAELPSASARELGAAAGAVVAAWTDPKTGVALTAETKVFKVDTYFVPLTNPEG